MVMLRGELPELHEDAGRAAPARPVDVVDHVVGDLDALRLAARLQVVHPGDVDRAAGMTHDVVAEGHVLDRRPGRLAALVARRDLQ